MSRHSNVKASSKINLLLFAVLILLTAVLPIYRQRPTDLKQAEMGLDKAIQAWSSDKLKFFTDTWNQLLSEEPIETKKQSDFDTFIERNIFYGLGYGTSLLGMAHQYIFFFEWNKGDLALISGIVSLLLLLIQFMLLLRKQTHHVLGFSSLLCALSLLFTIGQFSTIALYELVHLGWFTAIFIQLFILFKMHRSKKAQLNPEIKEPTY